METSTPEWIAKDCLDVGLFTNQLEEMQEFWESEVGLKFDHMLPIGGGVRQYRYDFENAVLKINHTRTRLPSKSSGGFQRLILGVAGLEATRDLTDPDGNHVRLVPKGTDGIEHWALEVATKSPDAFLNHYERCLELPRHNALPAAVLCGRSLIMAVEAPIIADEADSDALHRTGFRYATIQVTKVDPVHAKAVRAGAKEAMAPRTLGQTARVSFIKDNHGNWMEISQRASLTGSLAPG